ncbi:hypothetical protein GIB67_024784 [Kingdonia uniflora]|uniref:GDSL esterase/lipase n=1 Tax=Kingdonia uniflora TaxID=39325 RepID=A0A7J7N9L0_9MAGN|nr:hypothetical protein GIB67_024784 [Kingdonia uniflora]
MNTIKAYNAANLYNANVRKVKVMGLAPIGCTPHYLWQYQSKNGECVKEINHMINEFNFAMRYMVQELNQELAHANFIFCDAFEASMEIMKSLQNYGYEVTTDACCEMGPYHGWVIRISPDLACPNASNDLWWDQFRPTDAMNSILADNV